MQEIMKNVDLLIVLTHPPEIAPILALIYNELLAQGTVPGDWQC